MKVLFISPVYPYPSNSGNKISITNTARMLANLGYVIDICYFSIRQVNASPEYFDKCFYFKKKSYIATIILSIFTRKSLIYSRFFSKKLVSFINSQHNKYKVIITFHPYLAQYLENKNLNSHFKILNIEVLEAKLFYERYINTKNIFFKTVYWYESKLLHYHEEKSINCADISFTYSELEFKKYNQLILRPFPINIVNSSTLKINTINKKILFFGDYSWFPNYDGAINVLKNIFPYVYNFDNDYSLYIAGRNADNNIRALCNQSNVHFLGEVNDIENLINSVTFLFCFVNYGGGVRVKVLEALSYGRIVFTNNTSTEGIFDKSVIYNIKNNQDLTDKLAFLSNNPSIIVSKSKLCKKYILDNHVNDKFLSTYI